MHWFVTMEDFEKVSISEPETTTQPLNMEIQQQEGSNSNINEAVLGLLRRFLTVQQRRALAYAHLKRYYFSAIRE